MQAEPALGLTVTDTEPRALHERPCFRLPGVWSADSLPPAVSPGSAESGLTEVRLSQGSPYGARFPLLFPFPGVDL